MSDELPYPPPPSGPPPPAPGAEGDAPAPAPPPAPPATAYDPPAPAYTTPAYGYPPAPVQRRSSRNLWVVIAAVVVVAVLVIGVIAYVAAGYAFASSRISDATNAVNALNAHRTYVNATFDLLGTQLTSFETMGDPKVGKSTAMQVTTETQSMTTLVGGDDLAMVTARSHLNDQPWLTSISSGRLATSAARIDHARKAAATVKSATSDYVLLGQFFQAYYQALIDFQTLLTDDKSHDFVGESSADAAMQADAAKAEQLTATTPGLPSEYHDFLVPMLAFAVDVAKLLNANTKAAADATDKSLMADGAAMNAVDFTGSAAKIKSYYQHYRDDFNLELDKATT